MTTHTIHRLHSVRLAIGIVFTVLVALSVSPRAAEYYVLPATISGSLTITAGDPPYAVQNDVLVTSTGSLTIEAGATLYLHENKTLTVQGNLSIEGTETEPVTLTTAVPGQRWNPIKSENGSMTFDHVTFTGANAAINQSGGTLIVRDCMFDAGMPGEDLHARYAAVTIERCTFGGGLDDTIDLESVTTATISGCTILSAGDDGIDVGESSHNVTITGTRIFGCADKGISVGQSSAVNIEGCVIADSPEGVTVFGGSTASINTSTIIGANYGILARDDSEDGTGGTITAANTIIGGVIAIDGSSSATFSYCLSDITHLDTAAGNVSGDPRFYSASGRDFRLLSNSPAIDAASPALGTDPDGSPADIGAFAFTPRQLVINEINYASDIGFDPGDWIELYNPTDDTVHVAGWSIMDDNDGHRFDFPQDVIVVPNGFLVICRYLDDFTAYFPDIATVVGDLGFGLSSDGDLVRLMDGREVMIDSLTFGPDIPWPAGANGTGPTLALTNPLSDNANPANWAASNGHGTPGMVNDVIVAIWSDRSSPSAFDLGPNYPNPFNPRTVIPFTLSRRGHVSLEVYSLTGQRIATLVESTLAPGNHSVVFEPGSLAAGCYIVSLTVDGARRTGRILYLK